MRVLRRGFRDEETHLMQGAVDHRPQTPSGGFVPLTTVNNLTLIPLCKYRIGRADIEESNGGVAMNARPPQASYPSGNFSDTSNFIAFPEYLKDR
ncbi:senescence-associated protein [Anaeramoeba flamelloides]|uniref:Senescence-associated protein n=1 Tax=Anaeramoeba flamelloides TaxID=1746091 RepID=A0AAV7ZT05_9EUKA|nr:senescence-associated protein [Anaeramoeba flamelloides]